MSPVAILPQSTMKTPLKQFEDPTDTDDSSSNTDNDGPSSSKGPLGSQAKALSEKPEMICEVREYEGRYNLKSEKVVTVKDIKEQVDDKDKKEGKEYAMNSYRHWVRNGTLEKEYVEIYSPHIKEALRTVVKKYPGVSFQGDVIVIDGELRCVFHYRKELEEWNLGCGKERKRKKVKEKKQREKESAEKGRRKREKGERIKQLNIQNEL